MLFDYLSKEEFAEIRAEERGEERGIAKGIEQGIERGIERGVEQGEERLNRLYDMLVEAGRFDDMKRAMKDVAYRKLLMDELVD